MQLRHIEYAMMASSAYSTAALHDLGTFSDDDGASEKTADATEAFADDIAKGRDWSQYRLQFPSASDNDTSDDYVSVYGASGVTAAYLDVVVLIP